jgi:dethiobiotin synthetase
MNLFVTGTDTGVGKTFITAGIAASLINDGAKIGVYKPAQSGASRDKNKNFIADDIEFVKKIAPNAKTKCSYILEVPAAPSVAADIEDVTIEKDVIKRDFEELKKTCDITIVEGAGGLMTPYGKDFLAADIAKMLNLPIVIVARADLGTINHTLLTVEYAKKKGLKIAGIIINNYPEGTTDIAIKTAPMLIQKYAQVDVLSIVPKNQNPFGDGIFELVSKHVNIAGLLSAK